MTPAKVIGWSVATMLACVAVVSVVFVAACVSAFVQMVAR